MKEKNIAFIDWQNLHLWTKNENWKINFYKFRIYLKDKLKVEKAYYFLWIFDIKNQDFYTNLQEAWFIVKFREHSSSMHWSKKWNVDTDIVYEMLVHNYENLCDKIVLVSWDWDYFRTIKLLIEKEKFKKILFPNKKYSSLYKEIKDKYWINLSIENIKNKIKI